MPYISTYINYFAIFETKIRAISFLTKIFIYYKLQPLKRQFL